MEIILLRHFESEKNTKDMFSSLNDEEELTEKGITQGKEISENLKEILRLKDLKVKRIYCAKSVRAQHSAKIIADALSDMSIEIQPFEELLSTKSDELTGKNRDEVRKNSPIFMKELSLYDAGIFNSYDFHRGIGKELKQAYERIVCGCIDGIISNSVDENVKIICLHYSSITAAVINAARRIYNYPTDYYGKINADHGKLFWIHEDKKKSTFWGANCDSKTFLELIRSDLYAT